MKMIDDSEKITLTKRELNDFGSWLFSEGWWTRDNGGRPVYGNGTTERDNMVALKLQELFAKKSQIA